MAQNEQSLQTILDTLSPVHQITLYTQLSVDLAYIEKKSMCNECLKTKCSFSLYTNKRPRHECDLDCQARFQNTEIFKIISFICAYLQP